MKNDQEQRGGDLVPSAIRNLTRNSNLVRRGLDDLVRQQSIESDLKQHGLTLTNEAGMRLKNPTWQLVEQVIRELDTGYGNCFSCLETAGNTYIQTVRGFNGYHVEWRITSATESETYAHYRASYPGGSSEVVELKSHDGYTNPGEHRDLLHIEDVLDAFRAFYRSDGMPISLEWRILAPEFYQ